MELFDLRIVEVGGGDDRLPRADSCFDLLAVDQIHGGFHAEVAHVHGVLQDECVHLLGLEGRNDAATSVEAYDFHFAAEALAIEGFHDRRGYWFARTKPTVD